MINKKCKECGKEIQNRKKYCSICRVKVNRENWRKANKKTRDKNPEKYREMSRENRKKNPDYMKKYDAERRHDNKKKVCENCGEIELRDYHCHYCEKCAYEIKRKIDKKYRKQRYQKWFLKLQQIKKKSGCQKCGCKDVRVLQFHHVDPNTKEHNIDASLTNERLENELKKCIVLCANCHIITHHEMKEKA